MAVAQFRGIHAEAAMAEAHVLLERMRHVGFGDLAGALPVLGRLGPAEIIDAVADTRRDGATASVGTYLELMVANRVVAPYSKLAFSDCGRRPRVTGW